MDSDEEEFQLNEEVRRSGRKITKSIKFKDLNENQSNLTKPMFKCKICNKAFSKKDNFKLHKKIHTDELNFSCEHCDYKGKTVKYLNRHLRVVHSNPNYECDLCGKVFHFANKLKLHQMVHSGEKPYKCQFCPKTFRVPYSLKIHMHIHTNEKPYRCSFCEYACRDSSTLNKHENRHMGLERKYKCTMCDKEYKVKAKLKRHISEYHLEIDLRTHKCEQCDKKFNTNDRLMFHKRTVHNRVLATKCPICKKKISNKKNLKAHLRVHSDLRPFVCRYCRKRFKDKGTLKKHIIIHEPHRHLACKICGKTFTRKHRLEKHKTTHSIKKKCFECDHCSTKFYSKSYLIKHLQQKHMEINKYVCDICGLKTINKPSLIRHIDGHSNDNDRTCNICNKNMKCHTYLKQHYWVTHKVRYKTKKRTKKNIDKVPTVEVKVEPVDTLDVLETCIVPENIEDEDDTLTYSKTVMYEDLAASLLNNNENLTEVEFDQFVLHNMFKKTNKFEEDTDLENEVDKVTLEKANKQINSLLETALKDKKDRERYREIRNRDRIRRLRRREEINNLYRVIDLYNDRINNTLKCLSNIDEVKTLNNVPHKNIERKRLQLNNFITKSKLKKIGNECVLKDEAKFDNLPIFDRNDLVKLNIKDNDVQRLGELSRLAKKAGLKIGFPCFNCDKICRNFSALLLHSRKHQLNPKPYKRRKNNIKIDSINKNREQKLENPKPILKKRCDDRLKKFYENNIRGSDIDFGQFLEIYDKMTRENVNDFKDLDGRTDFGTQCKEYGYNNRKYENNNNKKINNKGYKRVIMLSKKEMKKRNELKMKLREEINKRKCLK